MSGDGGTSTVAGGSVISLPKGGGAVGGLGEKFSPDLFTGTGNLSVPIALPPGRLGLQPQLVLGYSTGHGNGPFGLGWALSVPGVARKTSHGVPRYEEGSDTFVLSGAEDLVPVPGGRRGRTRFRPRTEGSFARIEHVRGRGGDYWDVRSKDGTVTLYGTPRPAGARADWRDPAALCDPRNPGRVFAWRITQTVDALGNLIRYEYARDHGEEAGHVWDQPMLARISYADYGDRHEPSFLVTVELEYEPRPDVHSDCRAGFDVRSSLRCRAIRVLTQPVDGVRRVVRECRFGYEQASFDGVSLLSRIEVIGIDDQASVHGEETATEQLPPLTFAYSGFDPARRRFQQVTGRGLPTTPLTHPSIALVDMRGSGLPDIVELGVAQRCWQNDGRGGFELPRALSEAPPLSLGEANVQLLDADGDGRPDLLVRDALAAGYFPMSFGGGWSGSFTPYRQAPSVSLSDPGTKLIDLDGDGLTDVMHSGAQLACWFNDPDPKLAWERTLVAGAPSADVDFADARIRVADMNGDGLQDIVLLRNGNVCYWPSVGHGRWGAKVQMRAAPRLPEGYDPRRLLLGDVDGDGLADLVYLERGRVLLWGNQSGNSWSAEPIAIRGTPNVVDPGAIQLVDLHGTGMAGLLFGGAGDGTARTRLSFLDFTNAVKPHLLESIDNHLGAQTRVQYRPSTYFFLRDHANPATRWRTTLPFPVHVVAKVEVVDRISRGRLTTEYRYHHGYWDGVEREFRGFAMVEQLDTETFRRGDRAGEDVHYSPPTLLKTWFHVGPVAAAAARDWIELDLSHEYWDGDPPMLPRPADMEAFLGQLPGNARREALRALRGHVQRTEMYALDGSDREPRPYTVSESLTGLREEAQPSARDPDCTRILFPFTLAQRTTQWERGNDPMTQFTFAAAPDAYGLVTRQLVVAVPRGRSPSRPDSTATRPYLATYTVTEYARRDDAGCYLVDRVARTTSYEVRNDGRPSVLEFADLVLGVAAAATLRVIAHSRSYYDGDAFVGLPLGQLGEHGLLVRSESLAFTDDFLDQLYDGYGGGSDPEAITPRPVYLDSTGVAWPTEYPEEFRRLLPDLGGYRHYGDDEVTGSPGGYYVVTDRHRYDVHDAAGVPRGLLLASLDPLGGASTISYDAHDLLPVRAVDPAGLAMDAVIDQRVLKPREVTDANGNTTGVAFSPAGFLTAQYVRGKDGEGDAVEPSIRLEYDLHAFDQRGQPALVRTVRRVHHDTVADVPSDRRDDVIVSVEYFDGFGRPLQTRTQAEDTLFGDESFGGALLPIDQFEPIEDSVGRTRSGADPDNVIVSGWQTYDNKARVVEKREPFYSVGWDYTESGAAERGRKATVIYDPRGRAIRTVNPDGSEQGVIFGIPPMLDDPEHFAPTPWESYTYDANDNAGRTHAATAEVYRDHWNTPGSVEMDALERPVIKITRNGPVHDADTLWYATRYDYDIQGNLLSVTDAAGRETQRCAFDLAKRCWRLAGIDTGRRDVVLDAVGHQVEARDSKGALTLRAYDALTRPARVWARDDGESAVTLRQRIDYGDAGDPDQPADRRADARSRNLLGWPVRQYDEAGLVTLEAVDFKGNVLECIRRVIADAVILAAFERASFDSWGSPFGVDWTPVSGQTQVDRDAELLEPDAHQTSTSYDALNRVTLHVLPRDTEGRRRELRPVYNRAGRLEQAQLDDTAYVHRIAYDATGQRTLIAYGNGVMTRYAYDAGSLRLARLRSERYVRVANTTYRPTGAPLQDYGYEYDLTGNVLTIRDRTPGSGIGDNPQALAAPDPRLGRLFVSGDALDRRFTYDPIYRLLSATGRECGSTASGDPWSAAPRCADVTRTRAYTEAYRYDSVGSMLELTHTATGGFTRSFELEGDTNRLKRLRIGVNAYDYTFDGNGNMLSETTSRHFEWDHRDQLRVFYIRAGDKPPSVYVRHLYDASGRRVKKLVRKQGGSVESTTYVDGLFERHRWSGGSASDGENNHLHVMDDARRVVVVRVGPPRPGDEGPRLQFQLDDHVRSANVVVDQSGSWVSREEYTPYGDTSFGSFARKRYRFSGIERDEEAGLAYHGARYYAPWLARWTSGDPELASPSANAERPMQSHGVGGFEVARSSDELRRGEGASHASAFVYAWSNPLAYTDTTGLQPDGSGTRAHVEVLPVLAFRINYFGRPYYQAKINVGTLPGGSVTKGSWEPGTIDLVIFATGGGEHIYDLKPLAKSGEGRYTRRQLPNYVHKMQTQFAARVGTVLQRIWQQHPSVLDPIFHVEGNMLRIYTLSLPIDPKTGTVRPGFVEYSVAEIPFAPAYEYEYAPAAEKSPALERMRLRPPDLDFAVGPAPAESVAKRAAKAGFWTIAAAIGIKVVAAGIGLVVAGPPGAVVGAAAAP